MEFKRQPFKNHLISTNEIKSFYVFFDVELEYEIYFSLAITVFAVEEGTIIFWDPVLSYLEKVHSEKNVIEV